MTGKENNREYHYYFFALMWKLSLLFLNLGPCVLLKFLPFPNSGYIVVIKFGLLNAASSLGIVFV